MASPMSVIETLKVSVGWNATDLWDGGASAADDYPATAHSRISYTKTFSFADGADTAAKTDLVASTVIHFDAASTDFVWNLDTATETDDFGNTIHFDTLRWCYCEARASDATPRDGTAYVIPFVGLASACHGPVSYATTGEQGIVLYPGSCFFWADNEQGGIAVTDLIRVRSFPSGSYDWEVFLAVGGTSA